jgi:hypothetical protein
MYDTWKTNNGKITFIESSVEKLRELFTHETFDIIFANRVFHHFVGKTWKDTIRGIYQITGSITGLLKNDGCFCITDYFYDGYFFDTSASRIIYAFTSCKIPLLVSIFRKIEAKSAGVGVCFLSKKMWLRLFESHGLIVDNLYEGYKCKKSLRMIIYGIFLLLKNLQEDNVMILKKSV